MQDNVAQFQLLQSSPVALASVAVYQQSGQPVVPRHQRRQVNGEQLAVFYHLPAIDQYMAGARRGAEHQRGQRVVYGTAGQFQGRSSSRRLIG